jgi:hypothetical protein
MVRARRRPAHEVMANAPRARDARLAGLRTRGHDWREDQSPTGRRFPSRSSVLSDGVRSHSPLRGSPGLTPGSLLPRPAWRADRTSCASDSRPRAGRNGGLEPTRVVEQAIEGLGIGTQRRVGIGGLTGLDMHLPGIGSDRPVAGNRAGVPSPALRDHRCRPERTAQLLRRIVRMGIRHEQSGVGRGVRAGESRIRRAGREQRRHPRRCRRRPGIQPSRDLLCRRFGRRSCIAEG